MNKKLVLWFLVILGIFVIGAIAQLFSNIEIFKDREEALAEFSSYKSFNEGEKNKVILSITITTDKVCTFEYKSEMPICQICYTYLLEGQNKNYCENFFEESKIEDDYERIKANVLQDFERVNPTRSIGYVKEEIKDTILTINKSKESEGGELIG